MDQELYDLVLSKLKNPTINFKKKFNDIFLNINSSNKDKIYNCLLNIINSYNFKNFDELSDELILDIVSFSSLNQISYLWTLSKKNYRSLQVLNRLINMIKQKKHQFKNKIINKFQEIHDKQDRIRYILELYKDRKSNKFNTMTVLKDFMTQQLIGDNFADLWVYLIKEEYNDGGSLKYLEKYITKKNINDNIKRNNLWKFLIESNYKKGVSIHELEKYLKNIDDDQINSMLWYFLITSEYKKGFSLHDLTFYINNIESSFLRSTLWNELLTSQYDKNVPLKQLKRYMNKKNIFVNHILSSLWFNLIKNEYNKGVPAQDLKVFVVKNNIPNDNLRIKLLEYLK